MKINETDIENDISTRVGTYQEDCLNEVADVKAKLKTIVNDEFKRVIGDDVTDLYQWKKYNTGHHDPNDKVNPADPNSITYFDEFLKSKYISPEEKFLYISQYGMKEDNEQNSEKFISDMKKQKEYISKRKKELANEAKKVIEVYKRILVENQKEIETLTAEIANDEKTIKENNAVIQGIMNLGKSQTALDPKQSEQVDKLNSTNEALKLKIENNTAKLNDFIEAQKIYQVKIDKAIRNFRKAYGDKAETIIEDSGNEKETSENNANNNIISGQGSRKSLVPSRNETEKQIAKRMLEHISTMNWSQFMDLVKENGFQDVEDAKRHLGFFDRRKLNKKLSMYLGDISGKEYSCGKYIKNKNTGEIEYKEAFKYKIVNGQMVKNNAKMKYEDYNQIINEIETFNNAIKQGASYKQIEEFNAKIQNVYLVAAYNNGKRFSPFYGIQNELRNSLAEFSRLNHEIQAKAAAKENRFRTTYGINSKQISSHSIHNVNKNTPKRIKQSTEPQQK